MGALLESKAENPIWGSDFDGVFTKRQRVAVSATTINERVLSVREKFLGHPSKYNPEYFPVGNNEPADISLSITGQISLAFHNRRGLAPGASMFVGESPRVPRVVIATGRPDIYLFRDTTVAQADRLGINHAEIVPTPVDAKGKKKKSVDTKNNVIQAFGITDFIEDDGDTAEKLAQNNPQTTIHWIDYGDYRRRKKLAMLPNVNVVHSSEWLSKSEEESQSLTRNSGFRRFKLNEKMAKALLSVWPNFNPDWMTLGSALIVPVVAWRAHERNKDGKNHFIASFVHEGLPLVAALILDWLDGATARRKNEIKPGSHDTKSGGVKDTLNDRWGHLVMTSSRILTAASRRDLFGMTVGIGAGITGPIPAQKRAEGEARGEKFPESGKGFKDILGFLGTHGGRTALAIPATLWPNARIRIWGVNITLQNATDLISTIANLKVIWERSKGGEQVELPDQLKFPKEYEDIKAQKEKMIDDAEYKVGPLEKAVKATAIGIGIIGLGAGLIYLSGKRK